MENKKPHLSVVIPAYNEEKRLKSTVLEIKDYLSKQDYDFEIVVVDDGSKDKTDEIGNELVKNNPEVRFVNNKENRGKGAVVKQGMLLAQGKYRLFVDADNAIKINHIEAFWSYIKDYEMVIGSIELKESKEEESYQGFSKFYRNALGKLSKYLVRVVIAWEIHDTQRAFKLFRADVAEKLFKKQTIERWGFDMEIIAIAKQLGYKIKELPVEWINPPGRVTFMDYIKTLNELAKIKANVLFGKYKDKK